MTYKSHRPILYKLRKCTISREKRQFEFVAGLKKKFGQGHVYDLATVCKCLGAEESSCQTFGRGMFFHS